MYTHINFKTKKELKAAVKTFMEHVKRKWGTIQAWHEKAAADSGPAPVRYFQPGPFGGNEPKQGRFCCEGPHYPKPHKWYAECKAECGVIVSVK
jgi:hypothetical protein